MRPVNPGVAGKTIHGQEVYSNLAAVPAPADVVDIFRAPEAALQVVRDAIAAKDKLGASVVWMQLGVINEEAAAEARAGGFTVVMDRCPKIEFVAIDARQLSSDNGFCTSPRHPDVLFLLKVVAIYAAGHIRRRRRCSLGNRIWRGSG